jgi:hypothetical protein
MKDINLAPALVLAAQNDKASISSLVLAYRVHGLGGDRACRRLIDELATMRYLEIRQAQSVDRREKSVHLTDHARQWLREFRAALEHLAR